MECYIKRKSFKTKPKPWKEFFQTMKIELESENLTRFLAAFAALPRAWQRVYLAALRMPRMPSMRGDVARLARRAAVHRNTAAHALRAIGRDCALSKAVSPMKTSVHALIIKELCDNDEV